MLILTSMDNDSPIPADSAPPSAGHCRGAFPGAPASSSAADFDAEACGLEPRLARYRVSPRWMFVGPYAVPAPPHLFIREIQRRVEAYYGLAAGDMRSPRRHRRVARPRQIAMFLARRLAGRALPEIGRLFGDRDHTTVLHAVRAIEALRLSDPSVDRDVNLLCEALTRPELIA